VWKREAKQMLKEWRRQVLPVDRTKRKSEEFGMCLPGTIKAACERGVDGHHSHGADRMGRKEC
jgi:hypothetical protein